MTITSIILTENDPEWLVKCISKLHFANEIIISDNGSDPSVEEKIRESFPDRNIKYFFDSDIDPRGRYFKYENLAESDYVHWIHPDEIYSDELSNEIVAAIDSGESLMDAYGVKPTNVFFGTNFGKADSYTVRIFKKGLFQLSNTNNVHSEIFINSPTDVASYNGLKIKLFKGDYVHYANPYLLLLIVKIFRYEMINAKGLNSDQLVKRSVDKNGLSFWQVIKIMIRVSLRFYRAQRSARQYKYGGLALAVAAMIRTIAEETAPTEELLFREGKIDFNDTRGYINLKREKIL